MKIGGRDLRFPKSLLVMSCLVCGLIPDLARADGGSLRQSVRRGLLQVTVFTSPDPPRAGPVDVSVLVQDAINGSPLLDAEVRIVATSITSENRRVQSDATHEAATNPLLFAASVELPDAGIWTVDVLVSHGEDRAHVSFELAVEKPVPEWYRFSGWFLWPLAVVALYGVHRILVARKQRVRSSGIDVSQR